MTNQSDKQKNPVRRLRFKRCQWMAVESTEVVEAVLAMETRVLIEV